MAELPAKGKRDLEAAISAAGDSDDPGVYLSAFQALGKLLFNTEADKREVVTQRPDSFERTLIDDVIPTVVESIFPDRGSVLDIGSDHRKPLSIRHDLSTGILSEREDGGNWDRPSREVQAVYARLSYWDEFAPASARLALCCSPKRYEEFREAMRQHLERQALFRTHRFSPVPTQEPAAQAEPVLSGHTASATSGVPQAIDFSDLPQASRDRIAAAEIEADSILTNSEETANQLAAEAYQMGVDPSGVGYSPGDIPLDLARKELVGGRDRAAGHLFGAAANEYLKHGRLDIEGFNAKLDTIGDWIFQKFHINRNVLDELKRYCLALALRKRAAAIEATEAGDNPFQGDATSESVNPFRQGAIEHSGLLAHWDSRRELWTFCEHALDEHGKPMPGFSPVRADPKTEDLFNQAVRIAFGLLRNSRDPSIRALTGTLREPCGVWLDLMRNEKRGFERVVQLRSSHWSSYVRASEAGVAVPLSATRLLDDGDIRGIFTQSARFWDDIVARGFELEAQHLTPEGTASAPPGGERKAQELNVALIKTWMDDEGYTNETLAQKLTISERAVSSMRNNGGYHGSEAVTKLANLMGRDFADMYLPEAST